MEWLWVVGIVLVGLWIFSKIRAVPNNPQQIKAGYPGVQEAIMDARDGLECAESFVDILYVMGETVIELSPYIPETQAKSVLNEIVRLHGAAYDIAQSIESHLGPGFAESTAKFFMDMQFVYNKVFFSMFNGIDFGVNEEMPLVLSFTPRNVLET